MAGKKRGQTNCDIVNTEKDDGLYISAYIQANKKRYNIYEMIIMVVYISLKVALVFWIPRHKLFFYPAYLFAV